MSKFLFCAIVAFIVLAALAFPAHGAPGALPVAIEQPVPPPGPVAPLPIKRPPADMDECIQAAQYKMSYIINFSDSPSPRYIPLNYARGVAQLCGLNIVFASDPSFEDKSPSYYVTGQSGGITGNSVNQFTTGIIVRFGTVRVQWLPVEIIDGKPVVDIYMPFIEANIGGKQLEQHWGEVVDGSFFRKVRWALKVDFNVAARRGGVGDNPSPSNTCIGVGYSPDPWVTLGGCLRLPVHQFDSIKKLDFAFSLSMDNRVYAGVISGLADITTSTMVLIKDLPILGPIVDILDGKDK